jgi:nucleotide-binding universal stress UspA family protein
MNILIAYDGSTHADAATADLARAGMPATGTARVLTIANVVMPPELPDRLVAGEPEPKSLRDAPAHASAALRTALETARKGAERVRSTLPAWTVEAVAKADAPEWGVIKESDAWEPDLVVVGSHGRGALGRIFIGSVSHKVLTEGRCNLRIARPLGGAAGGPPRLLVGVDGSTGSEKVLATVGARRWPVESEVLLLCALDTRLALSPPGAFDNDLAARRKLLDDAADRLRAASPGLAVSTLVQEGEPKDLLLEQAEEWGAKTIFLGARGLGATERFLLGSVSTAVAMRAPCSVEVVYGAPSA